MTVSIESQVHLSQFPVIQALTQHLERARQQHLTGSLNFDTLHLPRMRLFFVMGRLVWAGGGLHRFRRWQRLLKQFCPEAIAHLPPCPPATQQGQAHWEYEMLAKLVEANRLSREVARSLIQANLIEVLFDIAQASKLIERFSRTESGFLVLQDAITFIPLQEILVPLEAHWRAWCSAHLGPYSPNLAPAIAQADLLRSEVQPQTYATLSQLLQGQLSLRELALLMHQDLTRLSQTMIAHEQQGLLELRVTPDQGYPHRPAPSSAQGTGPRSAPGSAQGPAQQSAPAPTPAKIFCVDDSPTLCEQMGKILTQAGYQYSSTLDPVQALQRIIEAQPDLIFIDLVMPVVSGYELCSQIRRIEQFRHRPIILFSGNLLDTFRARLVGADQTLTKPIPTQLLLTTVETWLSSDRNAIKSFRLAKS